MRFAVIVAPSDPRSGDASARREALAWLRGKLASFGFAVDIVGGGQDPQAALEAAAARVSAGDALLVHLSGRLSGRRSSLALAFGGGRSVRLSTASQAFASRAPAQLGFVAELMHEEDPVDAELASECLASAVRALVVPESGHAALAAVRPLTASVPRLAFTQQALAGANSEGPPPAVYALLAAMHDGGLRASTGGSSAQCFTFAREGVDPHEEAKDSVSEAKPHLPESVLVAADAKEPEAEAEAVADELPPPDVSIDCKTDVAGWERALQSCLGRIAKLKGARARVREINALARLLEAARAIEDKTESVRQLLLRGYETMQSLAPTHASSYADAFAFHNLEGRTDEALLCAQVLDELGAADSEHRALIDQFRSVTPVRAGASLDAAAWEHLRAPGSDEVLAALFAAIERAAIAAKLEELQQIGWSPPVVDRQQRLSETSTASVVRSFQWASRVLKVRCPDLYAMDDVPGIAGLHAPDPSLALGPAVRSGPSAKDLAFLAGRHLTYYRPEYRLLFYYPTQGDLTMLLFAAAQLAMSTSPSSGASEEVRRLQARLVHHVSGRDRAALNHAVQRLESRGGTANVAAWMRSVELTGARAGLLLCGDLAAATALIRSDLCSVPDLADDLRRGDLVAFCASRAHAHLRSRFVAKGPESVAPPSYSLTEPAL
jgi:hypothetical protein